MKPETRSREYALKVAEFSKREHWHKSMNFMIGQIFDKHRPAEYSKRNLDVLDVGCGTGELLQLIAQKQVVRNLMGVDANLHMLNMARNRQYAADRVEFLQSFGYDTGIRTGMLAETVDLLTCCYTLGHLMKPYEALTDMARVLRKKGVLALVVPNPMYNVLMKPWNWATGYQGDTTLVHEFTEDELVQTLEVKGFRNITVQYIGERVKWLPPGLSDKFKSYMLIIGTKDTKE